MSPITTPRYQRSSLITPRMYTGPNLHLRRLIDYITVSVVFASLLDRAGVFRISKIICNNCSYMPSGRLASRDHGEKSEHKEGIARYENERFGKFQGRLEARCTATRVYRSLADRHGYPRSVTNWNRRRSRGSCVQAANRKRRK